MSRQDQNPTFRFRREVSNTETNATDPSALDSESIRTLDQLSQARASVTMLDKLWTQIDVLDDVKQMADEVREYGGFFNEEFSEKLAQLKESQRNLLDVMVRHHDMSERARAERRSAAQVTAGAAKLDDDEIQRDQELTKQRMRDFFFGSGKDHGSSQAKDFDELNEYVQEVRERLGEVSNRMLRFDETTKTLW